MPDAKLRELPSEHHQRRILPTELQPLMQSLLSTLADIDFAHEHEVEKVKNSALDDRFRATLIAKLDQLHREMRQPYVEEVLRLQNRARSLLVSAEE